MSSQQRHRRREGRTDEEGRWSSSDRLIILIFCINTSANHPQVDPGATYHDGLVLHLARFAFTVCWMCWPFSVEQILQTHL